MRHGRRLDSGDRCRGEPGRRVGRKRRCVADRAHAASNAAVRRAGRPIGLVRLRRRPPDPGDRPAASAAQPRRCRAQRPVSRLPHTDWFVGQLARYLLGRPAMRALDDVMRATHRLGLVAPAAVLEEIARVHELLGRVAHRDIAAVDELAEARAALLATSRRSVGIRDRPRWRLPARGPSPARFRPTSTALAEVDGAQEVSRRPGMNAR